MQSLSYFKMLDKRKIKKGELPTQWDGGFLKESAKHKRSRQNGAFALAKGSGSL